MEHDPELDGAQFSEFMPCSFFMFQDIIPVFVGYNIYIFWLNIY